MYLFHLFRSFLPLRNPIGFGSADFLLLSAAALFVAALLAWPWLQPHYESVAHSYRRSFSLLAALPLVLRLLLLIRCPVPLPAGSDDFGYVLLGDTFAHLRLANPPHPLSQFFETPFVLQKPAYSSIYPPGQGLILALGQIVFGLQWAGILLATSLLCCLCYWAARSWVSERWALLSGLLAVIQFGPLGYWENSYWGGTLTACGGCLVFGSLPRLMETRRARYGALLGAGFAAVLLTRPFESTLLAAAIILYAAFEFRRIRVRALMPALALSLATVIPSIALLLAQNKAVTGHWTMLPYQLSRYEYGVPTTFTFQPNPVPHHELTSDEELDYRAQAAVHGSGHDTLSALAYRVLYRLRFYRFFLLAPLYIAFLAFATKSIGDRRARFILLAILIFVLGSSIYPYFYPHYIAAITCLFLLGAVMGLERLLQMRGSIRGHYVAAAILLVCVAHFGFWYGLHVFAGDDIASAMMKYDPWDYIDFGDPEGRYAVRSALERVPGKQLVFIHYAPGHLFRNWIHNAADIDHARVVWARDLGAKENQKLLHYYPDRTAWMLHPNAMPPLLTPYPAEAQKEP
jgi:hypothetical protein